MATKKKAGGKTAKTTTKKTSAKKTSSKKKRSKKSGAGRKQDGKGVIVFFMGKLIQAGLLGEEVPEESKDQKKIAMLIRQQAEKLARQTRKFGDEDVPLGEGDDD